MGAGSIQLSAQPFVTDPSVPLCVTSQWLAKRSFCVPPAFTQRWGECGLLQRLVALNHGFQPSDHWESGETLGHQRCSTIGMRWWDIMGSNRPKGRTVFHLKNCWSIGKWEIAGDIPWSIRLHYIRYYLPVISSSQLPRIVVFWWTPSIFCVLSSQKTFLVVHLPRLTVSVRMVRVQHVFVKQKMGRRGRDVFWGIQSIPKDSWYFHGWFSLLQLFLDFFSLWFSLYQDTQRIPHRGNGSNSKLWL